MRLCGTHFLALGVLCYLQVFGYSQVKLEKEGAVKRCPQNGVTCCPCVCQHPTLLLFCAQLAKPYCAGDAHTLPVGSSLARDFPCSEGVMRQLTYLATRPLAVYWVGRGLSQALRQALRPWLAVPISGRLASQSSPPTIPRLDACVQDFCMLQRNDSWVSVATMGMVMRFVIAFLGPESSNHPRVAPHITTASRAAGPVYLVYQLWTSNEVGWCVVVLVCAHRQPTVATVRPAHSAR